MYKRAQQPEDKQKRLKQIVARPYNIATGLTAKRMGQLVNDPKAPAITPRQFISQQTLDTSYPDRLKTHMQGIKPQSYQRIGFSPFFPKGFDQYMATPASNGTQTTSAPRVGAAGDFLGYKYKPLGQRQAAKFATYKHRYGAWFQPMSRSIVLNQQNPELTFDASKDYFKDKYTGNNNAAMALWHQNTHRGATQPFIPADTDAQGKPTDWVNATMGTGLKNFRLMWPQYNQDAWRKANPDVPDSPHDADASQIARMMIAFNRGRMRNKQALGIQNYRDALLKNRLVRPEQLDFIDKSSDFYPDTDQGRQQWQQTAKFYTQHPNFTYMLGPQARHSLDVYNKLNNWIVQEKQNLQQNSGFMSPGQLKSRQRQLKDAQGRLDYWNNSYWLGKQDNKLAPNAVQNWMQSTADQYGDQGVYKNAALHKRSAAAVQAPLRGSASKQIQYNDNGTKTWGELTQNAYNWTDEFNRKGSWSIPGKGQLVKAYADANQVDATSDLMAAPVQATQAIDPTPTPVQMPEAAAPVVAQATTPNTTTPIQNEDMQKMGIYKQAYLQKHAGDEFGPTSSANVRDKNGRQIRAVIPATGSTPGAAATAKRPSTPPTPSKPVATSPSPRFKPTAGQLVTWKDASGAIRYGKLDSYGTLIGTDSTGNNQRGMYGRGSSTYRTAANNWKAYTPTAATTGGAAVVATQGQVPPPATKTTTTSASSDFPTSEQHAFTVMGRQGKTNNVSFTAWKDPTSGNIVLKLPNGSLMQVASTDPRYNRIQNQWRRQQAIANTMPTEAAGAFKQ